MCRFSSQILLNMTKSEQHRQKAKTYIDNIIEKSIKSYDILMMDLKEQLEKWKDQYRNLSYTNVFDLTDEQYERKNYLDALIMYSEHLLARRKISDKNKKSQIIITGNNLSVSVS
jgi:hypothetical protein